MNGSAYHATSSEVRVNEEQRCGRALIDATRPFASERPLTTWWVLVSTLGALALGTALAWQPLPWWTRACVSVVTGLVFVRGFILYHDHLHGALLRGSWVGKLLLYPLGVLVMAPPTVWRDTHNYHHAHTAKLVGS